MNAATIRDRAAIVGIGQTAFGKSLGRSEYDMALEAILAACADAGLSPRDLDGAVRYDMETTDEENLLAALGNPELGWFASSAWGGGGAASVVVLAATAIAAGMASTVLVYRSRARGRQSAYGAGTHQGGRYWERLGEAPLAGLSKWHAPHGLVSAFQEMAMIAMRHRIEYGTTDDQYAEVAVAFRGHAARNPHAVMRTPITIADHHASRMISDPLRLLDCCLETDGAVALVLTSAERARDLRQPPAYVLAGAMAGGGHHVRLSSFYERQRRDDGAPRAARRLWTTAGVEPQDVDVACFYDFFTPLVIMALEDYGFCGPGEGGAFVEQGGLAWPDGRLPCNTNGGQLSEAFIHGFNNTVEAVRQVRGASTAQVQECALALVAGGNTDPTGAVLLRR